MIDKNCKVLTDLSVPIKPLNHRQCGISNELGCMENTKLIENVRLR